MAPGSEMLLKSPRTYSCQPNVRSLDVEEGGPGNIGNWTPHLLTSVNDIDTKGVNCISADVIPVDPRYQDFSLVVVNEQSPNHGEAFRSYFMLRSQITLCLW